MDKKCDLSCGNCFSLRNKTGGATEAEAVQSEASGLNRTISNEKVESLQPTLDESKTSDKRLCDRICDLWLIRKIIDFFKGLFSSKEVTDPASEETITVDDEKGETADSIVSYKQASTDDLRAPGDVSVEVQVILEKHSDTSDVLAVTGSHLINMKEPVSDSEPARETLSTDVKHEQESMVVHPEVQNVSLQEDVVIELQPASDSVVPHTDAESELKEEALVKPPLPECVFDEWSKDGNVEVQREDLTTESVTPLNGMLSIIHEKPESGSCMTSLNVNVADASEDIGGIFVDISISHESNSLLTAEDYEEVLALKSFERHEQECMEEEDKENKRSLEYAGAWLKSDDKKSLTAQFTRTSSMLNLDNIANRRRGKSRGEAASEYCSELSNRIPTRMIKINERTKKKKEQLQVENQHGVRMQRLGFGRAAKKST
ncbi:hypothetical protein [Kistimonas asteriae]|uniref:hypothetical protein n=1 Tax=Kistimonas asteriae TaxID=517724 RepID=UPI001BA5CE74|nr:hypothetical protein [Kistimonas asteriae]